MDSAFIVLKQVGVMFILIILGALCFKMNIITKEANKYLSDFILKIICPVLIFMAYQSEYNKELLSGLLMALILAFITYVVLIPVAALLIRKKEGRETAIERFSAIYSNCAFMGIPLVQGIFGAEGILYITASITAFNVFAWTHGIMMMKEEVSFKGLVNAIKSPSVIAVFVGFVCYITNIRLPEIFDSALRHVSNINTPLAMIVAGATIAQTNILKALKKTRILYISSLKLLIFPVLMIFIYMLFKPVPTVLISIAIATGCPTGATGTLFAVSYNKNASYSAEIFAITTVLSAITLPVIVILSTAISY